MGCVTPLGGSVAETWQGAVEGRSGIAAIRRFDAGDYPVCFTGEVGADLDLGDLHPKEVRRLDRVVALALAAAAEALHDSALEVCDENRERIGVARMAQLLDETEGLPDLAANNVGIAEAQLAGELFVQLEDPQRAIRSFDAVLDVDPNNADAIAWHGWTLALLAESGAEDLFADAEEWLDRAVVMDPETADARIFRAFLFNRIDRSDEARAELELFDALDEHPADMIALIEQFGLREALG